MSDLRDKAVALRADGMTYQQIADQLGTSVTTVYRNCNPAVAERDRQRARQWSKAHPEQERERVRDFRRRTTGTCLVCGGPMGRGKNLNGQCRRCAKLARWQTIQDMWLAGAKLQEVADAVGKSTNLLGPEMRAMRVAGWNLPHRQPFTGRWCEKDQSA
jgi:hypothetical protein